MNFSYKNNNYYIQSNEHNFDSNNMVYAENIYNNDMNFNTLQE